MDYFSELCFPIFLSDHNLSKLTTHESSVGGKFECVIVFTHKSGKINLQKISVNSIIYPIRIRYKRNVEKYLN